MMRKMSTEAMWKRYAVGSYMFPEGVANVKRTVFIDIVNTLKKADINHRTCIDCKLHRIVYENVNTMRSIFEEQVGGTAKQRELKKP